jgi:HAD superfamily hydrolase (TIGR01509 family)
LRYSVLLFDLDGTLVDSAADICGAVQTVLERRGRTGVPFEYLRSFIGRHLQDLHEELFPGAPQAEIDAFIEEYRGIYRGRGHGNTRLYPGVLETMPLLPGRKTTATTKGTPMARMVLEQFGLISHFQHVQGTDGFPSKPRPDVIVKALEALGARPEECLFVGDSAPDMEAGRAAGVHLCAVEYGYGSPERLREFTPEYSIRQFGDLRHILV